VLGDCLQFIDRARRGGGRVLVHCSQGVSRSTTIAIAFVMWRTRLPYDDVFARFKAVRAVCNPNIGFTCALLLWHKRMSAPVARARMWRLASHCPEAAAYLVPKGVSHACPAALDSRGVFLVNVAGLKGWGQRLA